MKPWKIYRPVVDFDEEQDPDAHLSEKVDPDPH